MAGDDVRLKAAVKTVEDELNLIKNQVQQTLLDIREHILDVTNPFSKGAAGLAEDKPENTPLAGIGGDGGPGGAGSGADASTDVEEEILPSTEDDSSDPLAGLPQDDVLAVESDPVTDLITDSGGGSTVVSGAPAEMFEADDADETESEDAGGEDADSGGPTSGGKHGQNNEETDEADEDGQDDEAATDDDADEEESEGHKAANKQPEALTADLDLVTLAALVRWVSVTTATLGPRRVEVLLDAYESAGRISPQVRAVVTNLCALTEEDDDGRIPVRDVLSAMVRMEGVIGKNTNGAAHRLMALLLDDEDDPLTRIGLRG